MRTAAIISHHPCQDGFAAATIMRRHLKKDPGLMHIAWYAGVYGYQPPPEIDHETDVYILDFSYPPEVMLQIAEKCRHLVWIDHHQTAIEAMSDFTFKHGFVGGVLPNSIFVLSPTNSASGAMLTYQFCSKGRAPYIIQAIDDRDRWQFKLKCTREITAYGFSLDMTFDEYESWIFGPCSQAMISTGEALMRSQRKNCLELKGSARRVSPDLTIINAPYFLVSELGNMLASAEGAPKVVALYSYESDGIKVSLRSVGDNDVSKIAKRFGGGGHRNAAGFSGADRSINQLICELEEAMG